MNHHSERAIPFLTLTLALLTAGAAGVAACGTDDDGSAGPKLTARELDRLEQLGIADVLTAGHSTLLVDEDGEPVGEVTIAGPATVKSMLHSDVAEITRNADTTMVECNGSQVSFELASETVPTDASTLLEPCRDALDVASILAAADADVESVYTDDQPRNLAHCIFLGGNIWCDGTTSVVSFDSLCMNDPSDPYTAQWVQTNTWYIPNGASCSS